MECKFNENGNIDVPLNIDDQEILQSDCLHYLGAIIQNEEIDECIYSRIRAGWINWRVYMEYCVIGTCIGHLRKKL